MLLACPLCDWAKLLERPCVLQGFWTVVLKPNPSEMMWKHESSRVKKQTNEKQRGRREQQASHPTDYLKLEGDDSYWTNWQPS